MGVLGSIAIALALGTAVGFEREYYEYRTDKTRFSGLGSPGVRSYALVSLLGVLGGLLYPSHPILVCGIGFIFMLLLAGYYVLGTLRTRDPGFTTELAIGLNFLFALFLGAGIFPVQVIIALTVILILLLSVKEEIKSVVVRTKNAEFEAFISYALIALVVLPFLPDQPYTLLSISGLSGILAGLGMNPDAVRAVEIVNPFSLWRIVVIITGIDIAGYVLERTIGQKRSWILTSLAGGFISSTSTTQSLAIQSKRSSDVNRLVAAALVANLSSFVQHAILLVSVNIALFIAGIPYLISLIVSGIGVSAYLYFRGGTSGSDGLRQTRKSLDTVKIFSLKPAIMFAVIFTAIKLVSKISLALFGQEAFFVTVMIASMTGLDAVTLTVGDIAGKIISPQTGIIALILANSVNLTAKTFYAYMQGSRTFAVRFGLAALVIIAASLISILVVV